jgi:hypothetical protein
MMFELLLDVMDRFLNLRDQRSDCPRTPRPTVKSVRTPAPIIPYPTGRHVWGALSQALRARLRSCSPSGTFAGSSHTTMCARHRPNLRSDRILHLRDEDSSGMGSRSSCWVTIVTPRRSFDLQEISQQALAKLAKGFALDIQAFSREAAL